MAGATVIETQVERDTDGFLVDAHAWTEVLAVELAQENGITTLSDQQSEKRDDRLVVRATRTKERGSGAPSTPRCFRWQRLAPGAPPRRSSVWGGGWLKYGNQTWGVDVQLSSTPAYQWYVLGAQPGTPIDSQDFALWNSAANAYLVMGHETWGVDLKWYKPSTGGGSTVHSASVFMIAQPPVQGFVPFLGSFGGGPGNHSMLTEISNSPYGATLFFIKPGHSSSQCGDPNAVITLPPGATMTASQMQTLYGSATPSLANPIPFLACAATNNSSVSVNVKYRDQ